MKKNLIYILGGAAALYFIYMRSKKQPTSSQEAPVTPDQALAPAFVPKKRTTSTKRRIKPVSELMTVANEVRMDTDMPEASTSMMMQPDQAAPIILTRKAARQEARSVKQEVRSSGGSAKQARQAARSVRKEARQARRMGELSVLF